MIFPLPKTKFKMLKVIYEKRKIKISDLIKEVSASQKAVYGYINELLRAGIIIEELTGKKPLLRYFMPNFSTEEGRLIFALLESQKKSDFFSKHLQMIGAFAQFEKEIKKLVSTALIFGSFARGVETKESDIDLLLIGTRINKKKIAAISEKCFVTLKNRPSIRIFTTKAFIELMNKKDDFVLQILKNHIIVLNSLNWVEMISTAQFLQFT